MDYYGYVCLSIHHRREIFPYLLSIFSPSLQRIVYSLYISQQRWQLHQVHLYQLSCHHSLLISLNIPSIAQIRLSILILTHSLLKYTKMGEFIANTLNLLFFPSFFYLYYYNFIPFLQLQQSKAFVALVALKSVDSCPSNRRFQSCLPSIYFFRISQYSLKLQRYLANLHTFHVFPQPTPQSTIPPSQLPVPLCSQSHFSIPLHLLQSGIYKSVVLDQLIQNIKTVEEKRMDKNQGSKGSNYKFTQLFGYKGPNEKIMQEDIISIIKFDNSGKFLSLGDKAGRIIVFEALESNKKKQLQYEYYTEFQSHTKEFDPLRSMDVEEEITGIHWLRNQGKYMKMLTSNSKSIKFWKIFEKTEKKVVKSAGKDLNMPKLQNVESALTSQLITTFPNKHLSNINSISATNNEEYILSSDDVHAYLWGLADADKPFVAVDLLGNEKIEDVKENITFTKLHPTSDSLFMYGTNKGTLKMCDLRVSVLSDNNAISFKNQSAPQQKNFITDMISAYSSGEFVKNGKYIATRDYLTVKVWDICNAKKPLQSIVVQQGVKGKLCQMFENQAIFDKFSLSCSNDGNTIMTGNYNNCFHMVDVDSSAHTQYELNYKKTTVSKQVIPGKMPNVQKIDYLRKTNACDFNGKKNVAAVASLNCFFIYSM